MNALNAADNTVVFWKLFADGEGMTDILKSIRKPNKATRQYKLDALDTKWVEGVPDNTIYPFIALLYLKKDHAAGKSENAIVEAYVGTATLSSVGSTKYFTFTTKAPLSVDLTSNNISRITQLDLDNDFTRGRYLLFEHSAVVADLVRSYINKPRKNPNPQKYGKAKQQTALHPLAAREEDCMRVYPDMVCFDSEAGEYRKDVIAITNSRAFRRTVDKAQLYGASKGDHYRTRMTHTQIVTQIALSISERLGLNRDLTEAIALAHDIGHTPFGHQGERTLDDILKGKKYDIIKNREQLGEKFGFKHNYQSVRVAVKEQVWPDYEGLNLSMQTLEGMLKHTKLKRDKFNIADFTDIPERMLHMRKDYADTLEGQVVAIADEIAQRAHDLDDALLSGEFPLDRFLEYMNLSKFSDAGQKVQDAMDKVRSRLLEGAHPDDATRLAVSETARAFTALFIDDVVKASQPKMDGYAKNHRPGYAISMQCITISKKAASLNDYLEKLISGRAVTNNPGVALFDNNAEAIVAGLFKAYYDNPRLLHTRTKRRLYSEMRAVTPNVIDFETGYSDLVRSELSAITQMDLAHPENGVFSEDALKKLRRFDIFSIPEDFSKVDHNEIMKHLDEYLLKRRILVRGICDFIAGMTDSYAINEYNRIVLNNARK